MPNNGTGYPLTFRCAKCKVGRDWRGGDQRGLNYEPTGRARRPRRGLRGVRCASYEVEYCCLDCGHVGWSKHIDLAGKYARMMKKRDERGAL